MSRIETPEQYRRYRQEVERHMAEHYAQMTGHELSTLQRERMCYRHPELCIPGYRGGTKADYVGYQIAKLEVDRFEDE